MDIEENVEIMVAAFILIGLILIGGYYALQKSGVINKIAVSQEQIQEQQSQSNPTDPIGGISKTLFGGIPQISGGWDLILLILVVMGVLVIYLIVVETW